MSKFRYLTSFVLMLFVVSLLSACGSSEESEQSLEDRVLARWSHLVERDFAAAWEYASPGFRQANPVDDFTRDMARRPLRWLDAAWIEKNCEEDVCQVTVDVTYQPVGAPGAQSRMTLTRTLQERWIRLDGSWWFVSN